MQPEGSTSACPNCQSSVNGLVLFTFDDSASPPTSSRKMGVYIPVFRKGNRLSSYWLSYRGAGNEGKASGGLSIHSVWYSFRTNSPFAASFDSLNYDAFGDTATTADAFVLPNTCYLVTPSVKFMREDPASTEQVQPIVCVDSIDAGNSITVSVSFREEYHTPTSQLTLASETEAGCSAGTDGAQIDTTLDLSNGKHHLIHHTLSGSDGELSLNACMSSGSVSSVTAFVYDS